MIIETKWFIGNLDNYTTINFWLWYKYNKYDFKDI